MFTNIIYYLNYPEDKIPHIRKRFYYFLIVTLWIVFLLAVFSYLLSANNTLWIDTLTHSLFESYCGIVSLIIAYIIYREYRSSGKRSNLYLFLGFFSMSVFDFFHAYSNYCTNLFVWFHSLSAFSGGGFFLWSAIAERNGSKDPLWVRHLLVFFGITIVLITASVISKFPSFLPGPVTLNTPHHTPANLPIIREFTGFLIVINLLASIFFLIAGSIFLRYFRDTNDVLYHVFGLSALLFFESELLFAFSKLWDPSWWYWHVIKLIIFIGLIIGLAHGFTRTFKELRESRDKLNRLVGELKSAYENLKNMQQELLESEKLASLGKMAATIAHEIRNPLGAIKNAVGIFSRHFYLAEEERELLKIIESEITRLNRIVTDFLNFAKSSPMEKSYVNLNNLIDEILTILFINNNGDGHSEIEVKKIFDNQMPDVLVDKNAIKQVLWNIIINAVQAMPKGGTLTIETHFNEINEEISILITDTGIGMSPAVLSNAFEPFFSTKAQGTGLGLSIAQKIIKEHGGHISISSSIGKGTQVKVNIPVNHGVIEENKESKKWHPY